MNFSKPLLGLCATFMSVCAATAAPLEFLDRNSFVQATSPQFTVDFNNEPTPQTFADQKLPIGPLTLNGPADPQSPGLSNLIASVHEPLGLTLDGTNFLIGRSDLGDPFQMRFLSPIQSFGADISDIANAGRKTALRAFDTDDTLILEKVFKGLDGAQSIFYGVDFDGQEAARFEIQYLGGPFEDDLFAIDNIQFSIARDTDSGLAPVPLPASWLFFLSGGIALAALRRRRVG